MNTFLTVYHTVKTIVTNIFSSLKLKEREYPKGRKPTLKNSEAVTCAVLWRRQNIASKKSLYEILEPPCQYNAFVRAINRAGTYLALITALILKVLARGTHTIKFTDATDLPVCLTKNARSHRTMDGLAAWSKTSKGWFYGLKLHLSADLVGRVLALRFTPGNSDDRAVFRKMNAALSGLFVADAGYVSDTLTRDFFKEGERLLITALRTNTKRIAADWQIALLNLRMRVEVHFRSLKLRYGIVTSLPRSVDGYLTHYLAAVVAHLFA